MYVYKRNNPPEYHKPVIKYRGFDIASQQNISVVMGKKKTKKGAVCLDLLMGSLHGGETELGFEIERCPDDKKVYYYDTEMAEHEMFRRVEKLGGDDRFFAGNLIRESPTERRRKIQENTTDAHLVIIDLISDLLIDFNDISEVHETMRFIKTLSINNNCPVICVLHLNPNDPSNVTKARGHLGTELGNRSQSTLRVSKKKDMYTLSFVDLRNGYIDDNVNFVHDDDNFYRLFKKAVNEEVRKTINDAVTQQLKELLREPKTMNQLIEATDKPRSTILRKLNDLGANKYGGHKGKYRLN